MRLLFAPPDADDEDSLCFQGVAAGAEFCAGLRSPNNLVLVGRELVAMPGCSSPCEKLVQAFVWARGYTDRKEAQKVLAVPRYQKRRSAVVEVLYLPTTLLT